jgi:hypothetical protein
MPYAASPRPSSWSLMELPPFPACAGWLAGFHRASPSTPLDAYCYVAEKGTTHARRICDVMPAAEDPFSHAEPATLTVWAPLGSSFDR